MVKSWKYGSPVEFVAFIVPPNELFDTFLINPTNRLNDYINQALFTIYNKTTRRTPLVNVSIKDVSGFKMKPKEARLRRSQLTGFFRLPFIMSWITFLGIGPVRLLLFTLLHTRQLWNKHMNHRIHMLPTINIICLVWILKQWMYQMTWTSRISSFQ